MKLPQKDPANISNEELDAKKQLKDMSTKERLAYFWYYYKVHTFITIIVIVLLSFFIKDQLTKKEIVLNAMMINTYSEASEETISNEFLPLLNLDPKDYAIYFDTSPIIDTSSETPDPSTMTYTQKITAMVFARELDVMIADIPVIDYYVNSNYFSDLTAIFSAEELEKYKDLLLYRDYTDEDTGEVKSIPVALNISNSPKLAKWGVVSTKDTYFTIMTNSEKKENAVAFLKYLYQE